MASISSLSRTSNLLSERKKKVDVLEVDEMEEVDNQCLAVSFYFYFLRLDG
jgi:hypothetical protein